VTLEMHAQKTLALRGPNLWARFPVLETWIDLAELKDHASSEIPGFNDRLKAFLPSLAEHHCSEGRAGGFYERLERGTYLAHILEHVVLELQSLAGTPVKFGKTRMSGTDGVYKMVVAYHDEDLGRAAIELGLELVLATVHDRPFDVAGAVARLAAIHAKNRPTPAAAAILAAARERRVPARSLDKSGLIQLGWGARQRRVLEGQTDASSAVANGIAYDRLLTRELLAAVGVPVPAGRAVSGPDDAWAAAEEVGLPIHVRPRYVNAIAASGPCTSQEQVVAAYQAIADQGYSALVESAAPGHEIRLLVVGARVVGAVLRDGDRLVDVADRLHPSIAERVVDATGVVGLDVAGVEVIAVDPSRPLEEQGGVVVSMTAQPDFASFLGLPGSAPSVTGPALAVVDHLFPAPNKSRIPVVSITGTNGKTTTTRLTAHLLSPLGSPVGMCCTEGIFLGPRRLMKGDCSGPKSAKIVLNHPESRAAVLEVARGGILREGLGFDRCDVAVVTNIGEGDHLGTSDIDTPEQLANVKSTIVWCVQPDGHAVLNAADPLVVDMAKWCPGKVVYFARQEHHPVLTAHRAAGGKVAFVRDNAIFLADGEQESRLLDLTRAPLTQGGRVGFHVENVLAATAAAWVLGVPLDDLRKGLESFAPKMDQIPARFNILDIRGVTVVLDYGHNTSAVARLLEVLEQFPHRRRSVVYSVAGDRRDADILAQGEQLGGAFDRVFIYEDTYLRGRQKGEITALFTQGMARTKRTHDVRSIEGGMLAIEIALAACFPGELLVIQPDRIDDGVALLTQFLQAGGREITLEEALHCSKPTPDAEGASGEDEPVMVREGRLGKSAVATRAIRKGEVLTRGFGPTTTERSMHTIQIERDLHLVPPAPMKFFNHSCEPNCGLLVRSGVDELEIHALTNIAAGAELTLDYETFEEEFEALTGACLCFSRGCRGRLRGYSTLPQELRDYYGIYVAEYLRQADEPILVTPAAQASDEVTMRVRPEPLGDPAEIPVAAEV
jgi:cyanophycin synthetase